MKRVLPIALICVGLVGSANAVVVLNEDFESMTVGGTVAGQNGWETVANFADPDYVVANNRAVSGTKSARNNTSTGTVWSWKSLPSGVGTTGPNKLIIASVDLYLESTGTSDMVAGLDAYDSTAARIGAARIQKNTGAVQFTANSNTFVLSGLTATLDQWNKLDLIMDFAAGTVTCALNGVSASGSLVMPTSTALGDVDLYSARTSTTTAGANWDNLNIQAVPEPGTMTALALGLAAIARRRKNS